MSHNKPFEGAGHTYKIDLKGIPGDEIHVEDFWDRVTGVSWMDADSNPAAMTYAIRTGLAGGVPFDDEVVYGKVDGLGHLVHVSELGERVS